VGGIGVGGVANQGGEITFLELVFLLAPFQPCEIQDVIDEPSEAGGFGGDDGQVRTLFGRVGDPPLGQQFGEHADRRERGLQLVRDVADEVGLLAGQSELAVQVADDEPASDPDRQHQGGDEQAQGELYGVGGPGDLCGVKQVHSEFPMGRNLADFRRDKGAFPIGAELRMRQGHWLGCVVQQRQADFLLKRGLDLLDEGPQGLFEARQVELGAEDELGVGGRLRYGRHALAHDLGGWHNGAIPEQDVEFIIHEPGQCALGGVTNELAEFGFGREVFRELLLGILVRPRGFLGGHELLLLRNDRACLIFGQAVTPGEVRPGIGGERCLAVGRGIVDAGVVDVGVGGG